MTYQLNSVALHITDECSGHCPMCYYAKKSKVKNEGELETLKAIADELKKSGVKEVNLVGGDPAEHSRIQELVEYLYELGLDTSILSNTHKYKNSSVERVSPYVSSLEGTFHASTAEEHNRFNASPNSYQEMVSNLKKYEKIRTKEVTAVVSQVSSIIAVREKMVQVQRNLAKGKNVIVEGRDIGTVVFPNADIKIYLDASEEVRAQRRYAENMQNGIDMTYEEVLENVKMRDYNDMHKKVGALKKAEDAIIIDSTDLTIDEVVEKIKNRIKMFKK